MVVGTSIRPPLEKIALTIFPIDVYNDIQGNERGPA